jgi:hypothetical protein
MATAQREEIMENVRANVDRLSQRLEKKA